MSEPWFDPNLYAWIPGTVLGSLCGVCGALTGIFAPNGKAKRWVVGFFCFLIVAAMVLLIAGIVALLTGQPYWIWYGLGFPGLVVIFVLGRLLPVVLKRYREAEERRMSAKDIVG